MASAASQNYELMIGIEQTRRTMIELGMKFGFTSDKTIEASQTLDKLINEYFATSCRN